MHITADYHTHTLFSHGKNTIEENVQSALAKGLKTVCISEHADGHRLYGVDKSRLLEIKQEILRLRKKYPDIEICFGVEANIVKEDGTLDVDGYDDIFDLLLVGMHFFVRFDRCFYYYIGNIFSRYLGLFCKYCRRRNTSILLNCIKKYPHIFAITHPGERFFVDIDPLSKECAKRGIALEINAGHGFMHAQDAAVAAANGAKIILSSDAHCAEDVGNMDICIEIAKKANIPITQILNAEESESHGVNHCHGHERSRKK
ncbi:MAG: PHP domain-containing protein [Eubacteriaceae bacterium]|jgi:putative hydrolase|nr:PHP domain-containing protein [Eubacteriaceae bacterium]